MVVATHRDRESTPEDDFIVGRFGNSALLSAAATLDRESKRTALSAPRGPDETSKLNEALAILLASGFHTYGSFMRMDPLNQIHYVLPFLKQTFKEDAESFRDVFEVCHPEYLNFELVRTGNGGDARQAYEFLLQLYQAGRSHWHSFGIRHTSTN